MLWVSCICMSIRLGCFVLRGSSNKNVSMNEIKVKGNYSFISVCMVSSDDENAMEDYLWLL